MTENIRLSTIRRARKIWFFRWNSPIFFLMCEKSGMRHCGNHRTQNIKRPHVVLHKTFGINTIGLLACELSKVQTNPDITPSLMLPRSERKLSLRGVPTSDFLIVIRREALSTRLMFVKAGSAHSVQLHCVSPIASILDIQKIQFVHLPKQSMCLRRDARNSKYQSWAEM